MNLLDRAIAFVSPQTAEARAISRARLKMFGYDAVNNDGRRGSSGGMAKNASSESPRMARDRVELMWYARNLERNMPIARCILDRLSLYVCGSLKYQSRTGDPVIDSVYDQYFENWMRNVADITGRHDFRTLVRLAFRGAKRDGDYFLQLVRKSNALQVRCIEADRVGDPHKIGSENDPSLTQGIRIDEDGRPIAYQVFRRDAKSNRYTFEKEVPANEIFHLTNPIRADEYRTVSAFAPVVGPLQDLYEMFQCELGAAKWASSIAGVVKTADPNWKYGNMDSWNGENPSQPGELPKVRAQVNTLLRLKPNEDVTVFNTAARPSGAFQAFVEMELRDIAMGMNLPYGFFDMARFGGAVVRLEAMQLQRTFDIDQRNNEHKLLDPIKNQVLENAIGLGEIPPHPNFRNGRWQHGPHLTADTGYDTDANLQLLANGLKTAAAVAGEQGDDFENVTDQLIKEAAMLRDRCAQMGVPIELVAGARFPAATQQISAANEALQPPPPAPQVTEVGEGVMKSILEIVDKAATGAMEREGAIQLLVASYGMDPALAAAIVPEAKEHLMNPAGPEGGPGGKPGAKGAKPAPEAEDTEDDNDD